jgi:PfaD family protein
LFAQRAAKLYELYRSYQSIEEIPAETRSQIERDIFRRPLDDIWQDTVKFFERNDPEIVRRAETDSHRRMALVFRWYLGLSSRWPIHGDETRRLDFQIWCGPAQGAFNAWVAGSFLSDIQNRSIAQISLNMLEGAALITRAHQLRSMGLDVPSDAFDFVPRPLAAQ